MTSFQSHIDLFEGSPAWRRAGKEEELPAGNSLCHSEWMEERLEGKSLHLSPHQRLPLSPLSSFSWRHALEPVQASGCEEVNITLDGR